MNNSKLKAVKPTPIDKRLKLFLYGQSGAGKTLAALKFPNAYIIDTEKGTLNYSNTINKQNSSVYISNNHIEIQEQLTALLTEKHQYKTLIIDPITIIYQSIQEFWTKRFEREALAKGKNEFAEMQDFGMRYWGKVKNDYKSIQRLINKLDMNVIVTAHQKDVYGTGMTKTGVTFDSMKGDDYFFDNVFRLENKNGQRIAITEKQRTDIGKEKFPISFEWSYENFLKFYGETIIKKESNCINLASKEQIEKLNLLITTLNIEQSIIDKWLDKSDVDSLTELTVDQINKYIDFCNQKLKSLEKMGGYNGKNAD